MRFLMMDVLDRRWARARVAAAFMMVMPLTACNELLEVDLPGTVLDATLENPANAQLLANSVMAEFACAFADYIVVNGLVGDEIAWSENNTFDFDRRTFNATTGDRNYAVNPCGTAIGGAGLSFYASMSTARSFAGNAHTTLSAFSDADVPGRGALLATTSIHQAYATLLLGEGMCEASLDVGPRLSRRQVWEQAEQEFTTGLTEARAANDASLVNMALVGRARARVNLFSNPQDAVASKGAEAVADAALVPVGFVRNALYATVDTRSSNKMWWWNNDQTRATIESDFWDLTDMGVSDPRVRLDYCFRQPIGGQCTSAIVRNGFDGVTPLVKQTKYAVRDSPIPIATWEEAQLIIAEVEGGQRAVGIINALHTRAGIPATFAATSAAEIRNHVILERQRELFLESHHLNDKIRFALPFTPATGSGYKLPGGGIVGGGTCFPYPDEERLNNPNAT